MGRRVGGKNNWTPEQRAAFAAKQREVWDRRRAEGKVKLKRKPMSAETRAKMAAVLAENKRKHDEANPVPPPAPTVIPQPVKTQAMPKPDTVKAYVDAQLEALYTDGIYDGVIPLALKCVADVIVRQLPPSPAMCRALSDLVNVRKHVDDAIKEAAKRG